MGITSESCFCIALFFVETISELAWLGVRLLVKLSLKEAETSSNCYFSSSLWSSHSGASDLLRVEVRADFLTAGLVLWCFFLRKEISSLNFWFFPFPPSLLGSLQLDFILFYLKHFCSHPSFSYSVGYLMWPVILPLKKQKSRGRTADSSGKFLLTWHLWNH